MLRIGQIEYANCFPIYHLLKRDYYNPGFEFVLGVPSRLNDLLATGEIDVCPSSSIEYAFHPELYRIIPEFSISSIGSVGSVILFSKCSIESLNGKTILLSSESATSVNLLKVLMSQRFDSVCQYETSSLPVAEALRHAPAMLLIGDAALRAARSAADYHCYDLGQLWYEWTELPFVFALCLCRREAADSPLMSELTRNLIQAKKKALSSFGKIAASVPAQQYDWIGRDALVEYWRDNLSYDLEERHVRGLLLFYEKCLREKFITCIPELHFILLQRNTWQVI